MVSEIHATSLVCLCLGEEALPAPSYYFTKPAAAATGPGAGATSAGTQSTTAPPDGAQRFSRRVRGISAPENTAGIAADHDKTETGGEPASKSVQPSYRMITKRIAFRRSTLPKSVSPWCRSRRRRYRKVVVYVDEHGKELSALDLHKRAKASGSVPMQQPVATDTLEDKNIENRAKKPRRSSPGVFGVPQEPEPQTPEHSNVDSASVSDETGAKKPARRCSPGNTSVTETRSKRSSFLMSTASTTADASFLAEVNDLFIYL